MIPCLYVSSSFKISNASSSFYISDLGSTSVRMKIFYTLLVFVCVARDLTKRTVEAV